MADDGVMGRIQAAAREHPGKMTMQLARELGVPEAEVIRALPEGRSIELDIGRWEELIRSFEELGKVHVIVSNGGATLEAVGEFGKFTTWGPFFNVQTKSLDMHIRWQELGAAFAVEKPSHMDDGVNTLSFQFFDKTGSAAFKTFVTFGQQPTAEKLALFQGIRERFRK
jgi:putative heme iron utilization protein